MLVAVAVETLQMLVRSATRRQYAIDDFGTGCSSLGRLRHLPVDIVKIDEMLIDQLDGADGEGRTLVEAILRLARELQLATIAEGIELESQLAALTEMGCDSAQGFLLSVRSSPIQSSASSSKPPCTRRSCSRR